MSADTIHRKGFVFTLSAFLFWGFAPVFWKLLVGVQPFELLGHRVVWGAAFLGIYMVVTGEWQVWVEKCMNFKALPMLLLSTLLIGINWFFFIYGVVTNRLLEVSLGYYINPLMVVLLGALLLGERLRPWQIVAAGLAVIGVLFLAIRVGTLPWLSLTLAISFTFYGLLRKTRPIEALHGLFFECLALAFPALGYFLWLSLQTEGLSFAGPSLMTTLLLPLCGAVTVLPLLWFGKGVRLVPLSFVGFMQYIAPSITFLLGVFVYGEPFSQEQLITFSFIWAALLIYSMEQFHYSKRARASYVEA
jgi:chloramphenicol-sensitive protein RarD